MNLQNVGYRVFFLGYANIKEKFHFIILQTSLECYFRMFSEHQVATLKKGTH